ncbi:MAG: hypothetical protein K6A44_03745 [bacterium]|nr:hypothetical protein [bacterium]
MTTTAESYAIDAKNLSKLFLGLKFLYNVNLEDEKTIEIREIVKKEGYLPMSHIEALETLSPAQIIAGLEEKFICNNTYDGKNFVYEYLSPVQRAGYTDSSWIKKEQHIVKLINLCALGDGNKSDKVARFVDILAQILTLPSGVPDAGILNATVYMTPFHPREFGCAYLPKSSEVTDALCDKDIFEHFGLSAKEQVRVLLAFFQLAGHPTMYDVLPQTARYSKAVLSNPHIARWFDIKDLISKIESEIEKLDCADVMKDILKSYLNGDYVEYDQMLRVDYTNAMNALVEKKKELSNSMLTRENQEMLHKRVKGIIAENLGVSPDKELVEDDIIDQTKLINVLISDGLWPAPGGAWNSCGVPVFDKMCNGASYPMFKHYNVDNEDVTKYANLDCQTPYYFYNFDKKTFNYDVIDFYVSSLKKLQQEFNFDGFRVDHIDHIVDRVSQKDGLPISYRAPRIVLAKANNDMKAKIPYFATLAEYMLWDGFLKEYHEDMNFDLLWGNDIISQGDKNVKSIFKDLEVLEKYNSSLPEGAPKLSILKSYNNQDGEFSEIDQYPGQLGENGALLKFFKYKFIVGGRNASRPVMFVDGDESFTRTGTEYIIGNETSLKRENNKEFFKKFNAINEFAKTCKFCKWGKSYLIRNDEDGFCAWVNSLDGYDNQVLFVINEQYTTETIRRYDEYNNLVIEHKTGTSVKDKTLDLGNNVVLSEFNYNDGDFSEDAYGQTSSLHYDSLKPSEFRIYRITNR